MREIDSYLVKSSKVIDNFKGYGTIPIQLQKIMYLVIIMHLGIFLGERTNTYM
jgi:hypothetical protein